MNRSVVIDAPTGGAADGRWASIARAYEAANQPRARPVGIASRTDQSGRGRAQHHAGQDQPRTGEDADGFERNRCEFAMALWSEGLFRHFDNRRQVGAYAGFAPTPWQSGMTDREQGIAKSGNPRLRTTMIQLAWLWLRHQPDSLLSH